MSSDKKTSTNMKTKSIPKPTLTEWRALYAAADAFKQSACWEVLDDGAIFGVQDPEDGQRYYCSVMGNGGMEYGIMAFRGNDGLDYLAHLQTLQEKIDDSELAEDAMLLQASLSCSFEDRATLEKEDLAVIKELGLKFRGRQQWPLFRDYTPGFLPWFLTGPQCCMLTHILQQALEVAVQCKNAGSTDILIGPDEAMLFRVPAKTADGLEWTNRFISAEEAEEESSYPKLSLSDQLVIKKIKKMPVVKKMQLEMDLFYLPACIQDKERPYYPKMLGIVDHTDGIALNFGLVKNPAEMEIELADALMEIIHDSETRPQRILVKQERIQLSLAKLCEQVGIEMRLVDSLPKIAALRRGFLECHQQ